MLILAAVWSKLFIIKQAFLFVCASLLSSHQLVNSQRKPTSGSSSLHHLIYLLSNILSNIILTQNELAPMQLIINTDMRRTKDKQCVIV